MARDALEDFEHTTFTHDGKERDVFRRGDGPAVMVIAEIPGITPRVADFARKVAGIGCTAVMPHLFGEPGSDPLDEGPLATAGAMARLVPPLCVSREFTVLATGRTSPVVRWLRALAAHEHERCGGPGVGAVGMCFTGGFALAMAVDDRLLAPVLSQPSLPFGVTRSQRRNIDISPDDLARVRQRCAAEGLEVMGLRFEGDRAVPAARFEFLADQLGDAFIAIELPDDAAAPSRMPPHSVLTEHLVDEPGEPTHEALQEVLGFFRNRLLPGSGPLNPS